jgi:hypothetical protein
LQDLLRLVSRQDPSAGLSFVVDAGFLIACAFVFALTLQGAASMLLDPCQR